MTPNMTRTPSEYWRLAQSVTVSEAALLVLDIEPEDLAFGLERKSSDHQPRGYAAIKKAILSNIEHGNLSGEIIRYPQMVEEYEPTSEPPPDPTRSWVAVPSLIDWLTSRGQTTGYFFRKVRLPEGLRDERHPRYSRKLALAVAAWEAFDEFPPGHGTTKQRLEKWIRDHAVEFGLTNENGKPSESVITEIATIANWDTRGGAPKKNELLGGGDGQSCEDDSF